METKEKSLDSLRGTEGRPSSPMCCANIFAERSRMPDLVLLSDLNVEEAFTGLVL